MAHAVLLGDSIFDNGAYVGGAPDVVRQLRARLPAGSAATLLAIDGDVTSGVERQLARLPADATHLVVSAGGNDALGLAWLLDQPAQTIGHGIGLLDQARGAFARDYEAMLAPVVATGRPAAVCTIYDANYPPPRGRIVRAALSLFNDIITRAAFARGLPLIDLRLVCSEAADYANPIEPSEQGGDKIAAAIAALVADWPAGGRSAVVA